MTNCFCSAVENALRGRCIEKLCFVDADTKVLYLKRSVDMTLLVFRTATLLCYEIASVYYQNLLKNDGSLLKARIIFMSTLRRAHRFNFVHVQIV